MHEVYNIILEYYLQIFARTTRLMSTQAFPILAAAVPIYDFLMDKIELFQARDEIATEVKDALEIGMEKLKLYYARTDESSIYPIVTSK